MSEAFEYWATPNDDDFAYEIGGIASVYKGPSAADRAALLASAPQLLADRKELIEALSELLSDTQHKQHADCEEGYCPVRDARALLSRLQSKEQSNV